MQFQSCRINILFKTPVEKKAYKEQKGLGAEKTCWGEKQQDSYAKTSVQCQGKRQLQGQRVGRKSLEMQGAKSLLARCYIKALGLSPVSMVKPEILSREWYDFTSNSYSEKNCRISSQLPIMSTKLFCLKFHQKMSKVTITILKNISSLRFLISRNVYCNLYLYKTLHMTEKCDRPIVFQI